MKGTSMPKKAGIRWGSLLARKMALTWAHKAQHGLTMPQESFNAAPGWPQEAVLKAWKRTLAPRLRFEWDRDGH